MKIIRDYEDILYSDKNKALGNCFTIINENVKYHYEFNINGKEALIKTDYLPLINTAIDEFRKHSKFVTVFYNESRSFYKAFDDIFTFKLPIKVIQPSQFFINENKYNAVSKYLEDMDVYLPVAIINDEYVLLDGHARLKAKYDEDFKMVNVYLDEINKHTDDMVYMAKEQNIQNISSLKLLSNEEYVQFEEYIKTILNPEI